jgi:hypothetical protein
MDWSSSNEIIQNVIYYNILYQDYIKNFSPSYLRGYSSCWYVGDSLENWWENCGKVKSFRKNYKKLKIICEFLENLP